MQQKNLKFVDQNLWTKICGPKGPKFVVQYSLLWPRLASAWPRLPVWPQLRPWPACRPSPPPPQAPLCASSRPAQTTSSYKIQCN